MVRTNTQRKNYDMKNKFKFYLIFTLTILSLIRTSAFSSDENIYNKIDLFSEVLDKINKEYVDEVNQSESMDSAINGLLQSLDP